MARYVTKAEGLRILAEAKYELKFARTTEEARYAFRVACKYQGLCDPSYCCSRSCDACHIQRSYNEQLRTINFTREILEAINK